MNNYITLLNDEVIQHHGILGQKWGIRRYQNKDGSLTQAGRKHRENILTDSAAMLRTYRYNDDISDSIFDKMQLDKSVTQKARDNIINNKKVLDDIQNEANILFSEFDHDEVYDKYVGISELATSINYGYKDSSNMTCRDLSEMLYFGLHEDGQQGSINAYTAYAIDKGIEDEAKELVRKYNTTEQSIIEDSEKILKDELQKFGDIKVKDPVFRNDITAVDLGKNMARRMFNKYIDFEGDAIYQLGTAMSSSKTEKGRNSIKEAKEIISKIGENTLGRWDYLNETFDKLGYTDKELKNLTSSDWEEVNREISWLALSDGIDRL